MVFWEFHYESQKVLGGDLFEFCQKPKRKILRIRLGWLCGSLDYGEVVGSVINLWNLLLADSFSLSMACFPIEMMNKPANPGLSLLRQFSKSNLGTKF